MSEATPAGLVRRLPLPSTGSLVAWRCVLRAAFVLTEDGPRGAVAFVDGAPAGVGATLMPGQKLQVRAPGAKNIKAWMADVEDR